MHQRKRRRTKPPTSALRSSIVHELAEAFDGLLLRLLQDGGSIRRDVEGAIMRDARGDALVRPATAAELMVIEKRLRACRAPETRYFAELDAAMAQVQAWRRGEHDVQEVTW